MEFLIAKSNNDYLFTNERTLCVEVGNNGNENITVKIVATNDCPREIDATYNVSRSNFLPITLEDYKFLFPNATYSTTFDFGSYESKEKPDTEQFDTSPISDEARTKLRDEIIDLLSEYDYNPTVNGVNSVIDNWQKNKMPLLSWFRKHPQYNGKGQIVLNEKFYRNVDKDSVARFILNVKDWYMANNKLVEVVDYDHLIPYNEISTRMDLYSEIAHKIGNLLSLYPQLKITINNCTPNYYKSLSKKYIDLKCKYMDKYAIYNNRAYLRDDYNSFNQIAYCISILSSYYLPTLNEGITQELNTAFPDIRFGVGQKTSRAVRKICDHLGYIKDTPDFEARYAKYSDAINPLEVERWTILSVNPVDYYTMSFGNSWASCHTIDKNNKRGMPNSYSGQYSGGTSSYMNDSTSLVFYTVDRHYDGDAFELEPKIQRCMFHVTPNQIIQGRMYPQDNDGDNSASKKPREIVQRVLSECWNITNQWKTIKGTDEASSRITTNGVHYPDYEYYSTCSISYHKISDTETENPKYITVGNDCICPQCGCSHSYQEAIECDCCYDDRCECAECGRAYDEDEMYYINGEYYCPDCVTYCEYHGEHEPNCCNDFTYVENYGYVCEDSLDNFFYCEECGSWYRDPEIYTEDGSEFCCESCAESAGYSYIERLRGDSGWYYEDDIVTDENGNEIHIDDAIHNEETDEYTLREAV